jgi:hypothetical protein
MNLIALKYCLLIGAILSCTAVVAGPLNPQAVFHDSEDVKMTADLVYQFGSDVFYKEINKEGNEYMQKSVEGYSHALIPTDEMEQKFSDRWRKGVSLFLSGYRGTTWSYFELAGVPKMTTIQEKKAVCTKFRTSREEMLQSLDYFAAAKSSATPGSMQGFTIGMAIPRIESISSEAEDAEIACMRAVLADRENNPAAFSRYLKEANDHIREMKRIFPELSVVSDDFKTQIS